MHRYEVIIYWSEEDQAFIAEVPELPGCAAHGPTADTALAESQRAIDLWLETAREFGDPIPVPKGRRLTYA
jgi:predicted RNase H-like HicB family nuclease